MGHPDKGIVLGVYLFRLDLPLLNIIIDNGCLREIASSPEYCSQLMRRSKVSNPNLQYFS